MTSEARPDDYEALWGSALDAALYHGGARASSPAAASILRDHVEAKLAEVRAELDQAVFFIDLHKATIAEQAAELAKLREALFDAIAMMAHAMNLSATALIAGKVLKAEDVWLRGQALLFPKVGDSNAR